MVERGQNLAAIRANGITMNAPNCNIAARVDANVSIGASRLARASSAMRSRADQSDYHRANEAAADEAQSAVDIAQPAPWR